MNGNTDQQARDMAQRALGVAESADRLAIATSQQTELLAQRMDHFEEMDAERRLNINAALLRIETGVHGLYRRGWNFVLTICGGLLASAGIIASVAFALGQFGVGKQ